MIPLAKMANYISSDGGIEILVAALRMNPQNVLIHLFAAQTLMICMYADGMCYYCITLVMLVFEFELCSHELHGSQK